MPAVRGRHRAICSWRVLRVSVTAAARIPTAGWYRVRDEKIASVRAFFDPRAVDICMLTVIALLR
jgi:limonene-1,2-epoxide hydrolase